MRNNYNKIAKYYDFISRLVFQKSIVNAQVALLKSVPEKSNILIVGGGTGWILEELAKVHQAGLVVTYVEISSAMIELARQRDYRQNKVYFIHQPVEEFIANEKFDVIITAFLFDNFLPDKIETVFAKLNALLKEKGLWLFADFTNNKGESLVWQKFLLKTMYLFFRLTCNIETQELIDMEPFFKQKHEKIFEAQFYSGFIKAIIYKKI